eukprot:sb/3478931/
MDNNDYPDLAIGSYSADRVVYLRSLPIVDLDIDIKIPSTPVDLNFSKTSKITINTASSTPTCSDTWTVYLNPDMVDTKSYIEVNMTASLVVSLRRIV